MLLKNMRFSILQFDAKLYLIPILIIWINRGLTAIAFPELVKTPDSQKYLAPSPWNFENVSLLGNATRPWPTTVLYALVSENFIVLTQLLFSGIASTVLILTLDKVLMSRKLKFWCALLLAIFLSNPKQVEWDTVANAQSLSNTLAILIIASLFSIKKRATKLSVGLLFVEGLLFSNQRFLYYFILASSVLILLPVFSKNLRKIMVSVLISIGLFSFIVSQNQNNYWPPSYYGFSVIGQLSDSSPIHQNFANFLESKGAPNCLLEKKLSALDSGSSNSCAEGITWTRKNSKQMYLEFLRKTPSSILELEKLALYGVFTSSSIAYGNAVSVVPDFLNYIFSGKRQFQDTPFHEASGSQNFLYLPGFGLFLFAVIANTKRVSSKYTLERNSTAITLLHSLIFGNILNVVIAGAIISAEWTRILATQGTMLIIASLLLIFLAVEKYTDSEIQFL